MKINKTIPPVAFGTWSWGSGAVGGDQVFGNHLTKEELKVVYDEAMKLGLNLWDTATVCGMGASEEMLGSFLKDTKHEEVIISTKFTPQIATDSPNTMSQMLDASISRLETDYIDIYWIHNPADVSKWTPYLIPLAKSGKIKAIGVSNHNLEEIKLANEILNKEGLKISAVQNHFSLLCRTSLDAGIIDYCKENDITFFSYMVLEQGALTGKYNQNNPFPKGSDRADSYNKVLPELESLINLMQKIATKYNATVSQVAIAWAIQKRTLPLIGVTKVKHVSDAYEATKIKLTDEEIQEMETLADKTGISTIRDWEKPMI